MIILCGLCHEAIQCHLLAVTSLTYAKALEIARGMESADIDSTDCKSFKKAGTINAIYKATPSKLQPIANLLLL